MVDTERLVLEEYQHKYGKYGQGHRLLDDFQLPEIEGPAIIDIADTVCRHLTTIFEQRNAPTKQDHQRQRQFREPSGTLQFQMTVPRQRHKHVGT